MTITVTDLVEGVGQTSSAAAVAASETMANTPGRTFLLVNNAGASQIVVTITPVLTTAEKPGYGNLTKANSVTTIATGAIGIIGPFANAFNNATGAIAVGFSGTGTVTARGFRMPANTQSLG